MIFLGNLEQIQDNKHKVNFIHYKAELLQDTSNGILIDKLPEKQQDGKLAVLYVNIDTKESFYEYVDLPPEKNEEVEILKKQVADLYFMQMQPQGGTN